MALQWKVYCRRLNAALRCLADESDPKKKIAHIHLARHYMKRKDELALKGFNEKWEKNAPG